MKKASITEAKNGLSALIDSLRAGSGVLIMDRGRPVARLEPVAGGETDESGRLAKLIREGIVRPSRNHTFPKRLLTEPPPRVKGGESILDALLEERREGR
jgi:antitoxin (DNA-binding transcriptional repressor) of toxin-antitoxin stability system